jgi:hypothetical protein
MRKMIEDSRQRDHYYDMLIEKNSQYEGIFLRWGKNHRRLLPSYLSSEKTAQEKLRVFSDGTRSAAGGVSSLQTMSPAQLT